MLYNEVFCICWLIFDFSLLKYTYHYNYRSHISLQVAKLAKSAGVQILIFPTVSTDLCFKFNFCMIRMTLTMSCSNREATREVRQRRAAPHLRLCNPSHTGLSACLLLSHCLSSLKYLYTLLLYVV